MIWAEPIDEGKKRVKITVNYGLGVFETYYDDEYEVITGGEWVKIRKLDGSWAKMIPADNIVYVEMEVEE